jgi:membrane-associated phospholipid phosphatase
LWLGCVLSYAAATIGAPYRDSALDAADVWIGLDWRAYLHFLNRHRALGIVCAVAYRSVVPQMVALFVVLAATSRFLRMQQYILATAIALAVTLVIFIFVPAVGTYSFFGIQPHEYSNLYPIIVASFDDVRSGQLVTIEVLEGLIAFPSFHTVWAILFMWAFYPFKSLRLGAILLNLLVIASTPVGGSHYFVDIVGGTIVALVALSAATRLFPDRFR